MKEKSASMTNLPTYEVCVSCNKCVLGSLTNGKHANCKTTIWNVCWQCGVVEQNTSRKMRAGSHKGHQQLPNGDEGFRNFRRMVMQKARREAQREVAASNVLSQIINGVINAGDSSGDEFVSESQRAGSTKSSNQREEAAAVTSILPTRNVGRKRMELYSPVLDEEEGDSWQSCEQRPNKQPATPPAEAAAVTNANVNEQNESTIADTGLGYF